MGKILTEQQIHEHLDKHYKEHFGERGTDGWYTNPAKNVWMFERDEKIITLQCHILTGEVTEKTTNKQQTEIV